MFFDLQIQIMSRCFVYLSKNIFTKVAVCFLTMFCFLPVQAESTLVSKQVSGNANPTVRLLGPGGVDTIVEYVDKGSYGLIESDIRIDIDSQNFTDSDSNISKGVVVDGFRWPNNTLPYKFFNVSSATRNNVNWAIEHIQRRSNIKFVQVTSSNSAQYPYYVRVIDVSGSLCSSFVGKRRNVGYQDLNASSNSCGRGSVVHEFLHALGFWHEQSRADRDQYVSVIFDNIDPRKCAKSNFYQHIYDGTDVFAYDYNSIMHYSAYACSKPPDYFPTIVPKQPGVTIGQRQGMSEIDINTLNAIYPSINKAPKLNQPATPQLYDKGDLVNLVLTASDPDGDSLRFSATNLAPGLSISITGRISGQLSQVGSFTSTVTVSDGRLSDSATIRWIVAQPNRPPQINQVIAFQEHQIEDSISLQLTASDPDGDVLEFTASDLPSGLSISASGLISGSLTKSGDFLSEITVSDGFLTDTTTIQWFIAKKVLMIEYDDFFIPIIKQ